MEGAESGGRGKPGGGGLVVVMESGLLSAALWKAENSAEMWIDRTCWRFVWAWMAWRMRRLYFFDDCRKVINWIKESVSVGFTAADC